MRWFSQQLGDVADKANGQVIMPYACGHVQGKVKRRCRDKSIRENGEPKTIYQGKLSSQQLREYEAGKEEKKQQRNREAELLQLNEALENALKLIKIMERGYLLVAGYYERKSQLRPLPLQEGHDVS
jgi:hypothetical protein